MSTKPILFNTDMVRAILEDRKTVTRRLVKDKDIINAWDCESDGTPIAYIEQSTGDSYPPTAPCRYQSGEILYVRETWAEWPTLEADNPVEILYKADYANPYEIEVKWRPSIHMPREAARIFLRVTDVRVERLQDITEEQARAEGIISYWAHPHDDVAFMGEREVHFTRKEAFSELWDSTIKPADRALYGWVANPWVWVIEFERCEKPKEATG